MNSVNSPILIAIEGLDGTGKTTIANILAKSLGAVQLATPSKELSSVRKVADRVFAPDSPSRTLFYSATVMEASRTALSLRKKGLSVLIDRYWLSTLAYAHVQNRALPLEEIEYLLTPMDYTVYLTTSIEARQHRLDTRGELSDHDHLSHENHTAVTLDSAYRNLFDLKVVGHVLEIDTSNFAPEEVAANLEVELKLHAGQSLKKWQEGRR